MFSATPIVMKRKINAFGAFLKKVKNLPELKACGSNIAKRGRLQGKMFAKLTPAEKKALTK